MESELPEGWVETTLEELLVSLESGSRPKGGVRGIADGVPSIGGEHLKYDGGFEFKNIKYVPRSFAHAMSKGQIKAGDILIVKDGATTGKTSFVTKDFPLKNAVVNEHVFICRASKEIFSRYLFWYLYSGEGSKRVLENFKGSAQGGINKTFAENTLVPFAPFAEQQRIVAKLDTVLARVNNCKTRLDKIPTLLKNFRQSVLAAAVSGELTKEWRQVNHNLSEVKTKSVKKKRRNILDDKTNDYDLFDLPTKWKWKTVSDVSDIKGGKRVPLGHKLVSYNTSLPYIKAGDLKKGTVLKNKLEYLLPETQSIIKRYIVAKGDVYITNVGAKIGDAGIIPGDLDGANLTENALKMCNLEGVMNTYLSMWLRSPVAQEFIQQTILSAAQGKLALGRVEVFPLPLPPIEEQKEIVRKVEELFHFADSIEARYQKAKAWFDKIPQAILAKAFKGQLVPQNQTDEPANVLLERIKKEKKQLTKPKTKTTSKTKKLYEGNDVVSMVAEG